MSKLLSFLGGVGTGFLSSVEKAEANAKEEALLRVKRLTENYEKVKEENGKLSNSLKAEEDWIKTTYSDATPEQIAFLQSSPAALGALKKMKDPTRVSLSEVINIAAANESNAVVKERIIDLPDVAEAVGSKIKAAMPAYRRGIAGIYDEFGEQAGKTAEMRYARAAGVDVQTMEALKPMQRPTQAGTFDVAALREPDKWDDVKNQAKLAKFNADKEGDPAKIIAADKALEMALKADQGITDPQKQFANDLAKAKSVLTNPSSTPAQIKEANAFYDRYLALEKRESLAKKTGETKSESIPKLSTLNSHASGAVGSALTTQFGKAVSEGKITFSVNPQTGETTPNILLTDPAERLRVATAARDAARASLSNYIDPRSNQPLTNDVGSALNRYDYAVKIAQDELNKSQAAKGAVKIDETKQTPVSAAPPAAQTAAPAKAAQTPPPVVTAPRPKPADAPPDAKLAPDGHWYSQDKKTGKYIKWSN